MSSEHAKDLEKAGGPTEEVLDIAALAVEALKIAKFVEDNFIGLIGPKLENCEDSARSAPVDTDMMFIALSLPIMNGIIHLSSKQQDFNEAVTVIMNEWRGPHSDPPEPISTVSALILIYVVTKGYEKYTETWEKVKSNEKASDGERRESRNRFDKWERMLQRVGRLSKDMTA